MNWKEFKEFVEQNGIKDVDEIFYIDTGNYPDLDDLNLVIEKDDKGKREFSI